MVNKADREGADQTRRDLRSMINLVRAPRRVVEAADRQHRRPRRRPASTSWRPRWPSTAPGWSQPGELARRRTKRARDEIEAIALTALRSRWGQVGGSADLDELAASVAAGETDPYAAADRLLE